MAEAAEETEVALPTDYSELVLLLEARKRVVDVCQALREAIDPSDDHYVVQIELASVGVIPPLVDLLNSDEAAVIIEVCETVDALCANIEGVSVRKRSGLETGFMERSFNPVQDELAEVDGIKKLAALLDSYLPGVPEAVSQTLWTCCSFNHPNKVAYLRCLVRDLLAGNHERIDAINALLPDMEVRDEVSVLLDQVMLPVLKVLQDGESPYKRDVMNLVATLCERHPASAAFLCEEGALEPIVKAILEDTENRSKAVHVLWQLVRHNKTTLSPHRGKLGSEGTLLIEPLFSIFGKDKKAVPESEQDDPDEDYSDEALLVLKALAEQDPEVKEKVGDFIDSGSSPCSMM